MGGALVVTGFLLFASDRVKKGRKTEKNATLVDVLLVGVAQAIATCPGISRSGTTITAGCFVGFDRKFAVRYSFLMSIPAIMGGLVLSLKEILDGSAIAGAGGWGPVLVGIVTAAVFGFLAIRTMLHIIRKISLKWFALYTTVIGVLVLLDQFVFHFFF